MPLRPIISSRGSPTYKLARFLLKIIQPLSGKSASYVKNSAHFVETISTIKLEPEDRFVSFDVESLFTNVPIDEAVEIIETKLKQDKSLDERTALPIPAIIDLLKCCLETTYFQKGDAFYQQKDGLPMGSPLSPIVANIYMEFFEKTAIDTSPVKPKIWLRYVDDTFIIWNQNKDTLDKFLSHLNNMRNSIKFTMETESNKTLAFLDVLVKRDGGQIHTSVFRKKTHTGRYLNYNSNHSDTTKIGIAKTLVHRARTICNSQESLRQEMTKITQDLVSNGFPIKIIEQATKYDNTHKPQNNETIEQIPTLSLPYIKGVSEKIKRISTKYKIRTVFTSNTHTLKQSLTKTKPEGQKDTSNCIYKIPCKCGGCYIGETKRPLDTRLKEHKNHTARAETTKSGVADHVWKNGHNVDWNNVKVIAKETNWTKRKFKEAVFIANDNNTFSHPSYEISNVWKPIMRNIKPTGTISI